MPRKKKQPGGADLYALYAFNLDDIFKHKASAGVEVQFENSDPGRALICRAYTGDAAYSILKLLEEKLEPVAKDIGWDEAGLRWQIGEFAKGAYEIFQSQLWAKLREALEELKLEAVTAVLLNAMFEEVRNTAPRVDAVLRFGDNWKKRRIAAPTRGRTAVWTSHSRAVFLSYYEQALVEAQGARKLYQAAHGRVGWREAIKSAHPKLPDAIIDKVPLRAYKPSDLAREVAAMKMDIQDSEYLNKVLILARREGLDLYWKPKL